MHKPAKRIMDKLQRFCINLGVVRPHSLSIVGAAMGALVHAWAVPREKMRLIFSLGGQFL